MRNVKTTMVIGVVVLFANLAFGALPKYEIVDLGTLGGRSSYANGINDSGQVVGNSSTPERRGHGFIWGDDNGMVDMNDLLDENSEFDSIESAIAINNNGQVIGTRYISQIIPTPFPGGLPRFMRPEYSYFLWDSDAGFTEFTGFDIHFSKLVQMGGTVGPIAINSNMQVAGTKTIFMPTDSPIGPIQLSIGYHASVWDSVNGMTDLGTLGGTNSHAYNINEFGAVVGSSGTGNVNENGRSEARAFLCDDQNGMLDLGTLGGNDSSAWAVNNSGKVAGASQTGQLDQYQEQQNHAFIWSETDGMVNIHGNRYSSSIAYGINDGDQVVGVFGGNMHINHLSGMVLFGRSIIPIPFGTPSETFESAFLWDKKYDMINLNDLIDHDSGWDHLLSAKAINNKGQIIGRGINSDGDYRAFLMTPIPPIAAEVDITPKTINLSSSGRWISCSVKLPQEYDVADIDTASIRLEDWIRTQQVSVDEKKQVVTMEFDRIVLQDILKAGEVELTVSGELIDGAQFEGSTSIKIIDNGSRPNSEMQLAIAEWLLHNSIARAEQMKDVILDLQLHTMSLQGLGLGVLPIELLNDIYREYLKQHESLVNGEFLGMSLLINSTDIVTIDLGKDTIEFQCFDLTLAGLGLDPDIEFGTLTLQELRDLEMVLTEAQGSVIEAIVGLGEYYQMLSEYEKTKGYDKKK